MSDEELVAAYRADSICPDCRDGKHRNCTNTAWSNLFDEEVSCSCHGTPEHGTRRGQQQTDDLLKKMEAGML